MSDQKIEQFGASKNFGGWTKMFSHPSESCGGEMKFSVFLPPQAESGNVPVLYWLSGLTCNHENFITKAGAQQYAAQSGIMLVAPDTSPRGAGVQGEDDDYDLGSGAGFYINATEDKWAANYRMEDYIIHELPKIIGVNFPVVKGKESIFGHSMGGHGALTLALKNPGRFCSVSAFSPICAPSQCQWGEKVFTNYLGENRESWKKHDANELIQNSTLEIPLLIDQGGDDPFLEKELNFELFRNTCEKRNQKLTARLQSGYDHSYYFIATFMEDHIQHHAKAFFA
ncbi:MAG: S-formylglutathione hydrolase [SAR324 cluster bacterium]|jgi:S-formylglutathione hydrolase|nr:S-formylglutathione hydrolase [SAR324 cluster bacterium]MDP6332641.1 S-formylglutathione hydrolase [SAR324 cluster bacterium]MEC9069582.1 S-formylglutathione hydrolase [SAR324 cluster bacterium]MEC9360890.1 S-formylglutathione hydrolase [SAR324 cluster bacterium]|tara:strand:- start:1178 stop:2029 length:852 start_codon:yes stop_codon:yes gene_type:complete